MANHILLPKIRPNGQHLRQCFCILCRQNQYTELSNTFTPEQLYDIAFVQLPRSEEAKLDRLFYATLRKICYRKAYKDACLRNTPYTEFGWWLRTQPRYAGVNEKILAKFCVEVNRANSVYKDWEKIVQNLSNPQVTHLDARKFSIDMFYRARSMNWCLNENELKRSAGGEADIVYEEFKYQQILHYIVTTNILLDIDYDPLLTSMLGRRIQRDIMRISSENR